MQLSQRLLAVADLASAGYCLADVGTDHGYIPIYLMEKGNYERAIAMDVRKGPLLRAEENRKSHGFEDRMDLRLSDGVAALREGEADTVVIAGMGGGLVIHILTEGAKVLKSVEMRVKHGKMTPLTEIEQKYGPVLLAKKDPVLKEFLEREERKFTEIREHLAQMEGEKAAFRKKEVEKELEDIRAAKERLD